MCSLAFLRVGRPQGRRAGQLCSPCARVNGRGDAVYSVCTSSGGATKVIGNCCPLRLDNNPMYGGPLGDGTRPRTPWSRDVTGDWRHSQVKRRWFARNRRRAWEDGHVSLGRGKDADPGGEQASLQRFVLKTRKCQAPVSQKENSTLAKGSHFDNSQASMVAEE